ncbi:MAG: hypothetical protein WAL91_13450, partial [Propionicimonas sp.]
RIVVSYDVDGLSWTGTPLPTAECLDRIRAIDTAGKCDYRPGNFHNPGRPPLDNDTEQRRVAAAQASAGADWVLQLDTDEVILDPHELLLAVVDADARGAVGVEYPSRYLYCRAEDGRFLEFVRPGWRVMANYPGPIAIRAGSRPRHARQIDGGLYRVDFAPNNTDPRHEFDATVHRVISPDQGIVHYYWVRSEEYLRRKMGWSGHADTYSEPRRLTAWRWHSRHPVLSAIRPASGPDREWFRLVRLSGDRTFWRGEL